MTAQLKFARVDDYLTELATRGPNVDLIVRLALRRPRVPGSGSNYDLYLTSSYVRDIGPGKDYQSTLVYVTFDHRIGTLTGVPHNDNPVEAEAQRIFDLIVDRVSREPYELAAGFYLHGR